MKTNLFFLALFILLSLSIATDAQEDRDIVVAIIDTGVDIEHPLIRDHLWKNPKEKDNERDNDGNGYAGDLHGWNFVSNNHDLSDSLGHGTHVAGIIQQQARNHKVRFMILKYYDPQKSGQENLLNTVKAIRYATEMGADIINYSGGGDERSLMEEAAIRDAQRKGILFIAAAGNEGRNTDLMGFYPAGYRLANVLSVAAMDQQKRKLASSNFGSRSVDVIAPGKNIYSALPGGKYGLMSGTSQATAWVSGQAARWLAQNHGNIQAEELKKILTTRYAFKQ
ncbi:S8 family peptidase [Bdellovibrio sp. HCB2-146]|uniref:S8 family peptidase n=1 Tax=Bdellovibrio sp. HCB2-146 TaxID=3394362 RepID=UPI0039BD3B42